ncbi:nuclear pore complex protein Nup214 isoform X2 [Drosophila miranda]|uniref:nuclear pore complex protein Nup214 isoform X2 n=1 Tax=Drosophila miranda TaxID=7229 RepID=UPI0007E66D5F|nr:nuclear pore complex protein Nup214 isoform X2 [Drosophila miranda]
MNHQARLSLSIMSPHHSNPIADSTRIDGSPVAHRHSPANLMHRTMSLERSQSTTNGTPGNRTASSTTTMSRQKLNLSLMDPKTFADVHSSGLASRIVAYHNDSTVGGRRGLQRSISVSNLYNPLKQPRRTPSSPLPYRPSPPSLSMTRIAPPERSFYCGSSLPGLLRSNSVVGVHKVSNNEHEQLSRENRPILHPHPPQHESEPTRSVLEELKEISRKRINSGKQHEFFKRSCHRIGDFVDHHHHPTPVTTFKRQRELSVAVPLRHHHAATMVPPLAPPTQTQHHLQPTEAVSPEQLAKRRNCSYNNDIASSLSSSRRHVTKRKLYEMRESMRQTSMEGTANGSSPENSPSAPVSKMQRKTDAEPIAIANSLPIVGVPVVAPSRTISAPAMGQQHQINTELHRNTAVDLPLAASKPKLTLFNTKQTQQQVQEQTKHYDLESPDVDAGEYAGINFVKPKQQNSLSGVKNPSVERTHKTKLAIMLSGLRGEIYQGEEEEPDEMDAPVSPKTPIKPIVLTTTKAVSLNTTTKVSLSTITKTTTTSSSDKPIILSDKVIAPAPGTGTATATATATTTMTNGLQPKLLFGQAPTTPATAEAAAPNESSKETPTAVSTAPTTSSSMAATPVLTFGSQKSTATVIGAPLKTTSVFAPTISAPAPVLSFGKSPPVDTAIPFKLESNPTNKMNGIPTIGTATTSVSTPAATASPAAMTFGSTTTNNATSTAEFMFGKTEESSAPAAAKPPVFSFAGSTASAPTPTPTQTPTATATPSPATGTGTSLFGNPQPHNNSFGSAFTQPEANKAATTVPEPAKPSAIIGVKPNFGGNSFGSAFKQPAATVAATATTTTTIAEPTKAFSFTGTTNTAAAATSNLFAFGSAAVAKPAEPAPAPAPAPAPTSGNIFGQSATASTPALFSFGGAAAAAASNTIKETKPAFAFGGDASATTAVQSNGSNSSGSNNLFNFGAGVTSEAPPSFGGATSTNAPSNSAFSFSTAQKPTSQIGNNAAPTAAKPFAFGGGQPQVPETTASTAGSAASPGGFSFVAAAGKKEAAASGASLFGTPNNASTGVKPSFSFGGSSNNQGAATATPPAGQQQQSAPGQPGAFSFAAVAKKETSGASIFGQPAATATPSASIKPSFSFGGSSNNTQNAPSAHVAAPSFGGFGAPAVPATSNQSKPFAFGGTTTAAPNATPAIGGNLFASAVSAVQNQAKPGGFAFGGTTTKTNAPAPPGNAPFSFGGAAAGGMASPPSSQNVNTAKPFSFGGGVSAFGSPSPSPVQAAAATNPGAGAFSFGSPAPPSASVAPGMSQQINAGNMFALPPSTSEQRPIRRATRRLQK